MAQRSEEGTGHGGTVPVPIELPVEGRAELPVEGRAELPEEAYAVGLASLPGVGPARLRALCAEGSPQAAWRSLCDGTARTDPSAPPRAAASRAPWVTAAAAAAASLDLAGLWQAHCRAGVRVLLRGQAGYPRVLGNDPEAPAVLFCLGDPAPLDARARVAVVGTRAATRYGLGLAAQLGADLAAVGVVVVSGLALGIDGAAHEGAVAAWQAAHADATARVTSDSDIGGDGPSGAPPVAVVAGSPSTPYPAQHARLWERVATAGAILSEAPLGAADLGWRFPMRNRIIAALADVVVVVECHVRGGALHTVHAAAARGIPVGAVPGSVRSPASAGTNALLADGCFVVRDVADVLVALGLATASAAPLRSSERRQAAVAADAIPAGATAAGPRDDAAAVVLDALGWEAASLDEIARHTDRPLDEVAAALERLRRHGIVEGAGGIWRRV